MSVTTPPPTTTAPDPFSQRLKNATWNDHSTAEHHGFTKALLEGELPLDGYTAMVAQHHFAYVALEGVARELADHPVAGGFHRPELERVPALERDLEHLLGSEWRDRISPSRPTRTYVARIEQMVDHPEGFVAHHYTRYMGDVSGGQFIRRVAVETYGFEKGAGTAFYDFGALGSLPRFRSDYRDRLDALELDEAAAGLLIEETRLAYRLNTEVLADLGRHHV
ncbi:heme oxygenase (biliverdin-producing) [Nocardiopsis alba]|nr:biliverdin-producing heme oxygenase [Nocardiopsis alba]